MKELLSVCSVNNARVTLKYRELIELISNILNYARYSYLHLLLYFSLEKYAFHITLCAT